jgi:diguanylate cyclase (GGDEF)-like protein
MNTKKKISLTLIIVMSLMFLILIVNILFNFRDYGIQSVENKAKAIAETVKHSLTSHMVNGVIDNREFFLDSIKKLSNIDEIWLARAPAVIKQFGKGFNNEIARDDIDTYVINTGIEQAIVTDSIFGRSTYRITIPYIGRNDGKINCLDCHNAKQGETLGAISIAMSVNDIKTTGLETVSNTVLIAFFLMAFILYFVNRLVGPFLSLFDSIKDVMQKAQEGDYSPRIENAKGKDAKDVAIWVNGLLSKLQITLDDIENKISSFLVHQKKADVDPLIDVKGIVTRLSDIYRFRKTIEHDERIDEVYKRLAHILREKFGLDNFNFIEADTTRKEINVVYIEKELHCVGIETGCRADRTNTIVDSCQFNDMCEKFQSDKEYLCIPYSISNDLDFIVSIVAESKDELSKIKEFLPSIQDFIDAAKPEIVSKKLMSILEISARTDSLTGLFNRKYLEESIDKIVSQAKRTDISYGILMADIDFFKMVNDTYGHDVGDDAIKIIAQTLVENTRDSDIVIRYGGEEFIVLLYNCNEDYIKEIAEKIRIAFSKKVIPVGNSSITKTISIGASLFPTHTDSFWQCVKYADISLYEAKDTGRNKVVVFDKSLLKDGEMEEVY